MKYHRFLLMISIAVLLLPWFAGCAGTRNNTVDPLDRAWWNDGDNAPPVRGVALSSRYLTMRDGVNIAIDVYLPDDLNPGEKLPTILLQTRYWRRIEFRWPFRSFMNLPDELRQLIDRGYAVVRLDARGSGASFGTRSCPWSSDEVKDGAQVVDWIVQQPWSDGKVGSVGGSYEGTTAEMLLINRHPAVKAIVPMFSLYDVYTDIAYPGGIHLDWFTRTWQKGNQAMDLNRPQDALWYAPIFAWGVPPVDADKNRELLQKAAAEHAANYHVHKEALAITFRDDASPMGFTPDAFSPHAFREAIEQSGAAVYSYSGWFDGGYAHAAIKRFLTLKNPGQRLILGPWDHGGDDHVRPFATPLQAKFDHVEQVLRFFDYHLKGKSTGIEHEQPVHYYTMVQDKWKSAGTWPPPATRTVLHLAAGNELLLSPPTVDTGADAYHVDRFAGTGSLSRWNCLAVELAVNYPDRAEQDGKLIVYQTPPLAKDMEVTGHPIVTLYIRCDSPDAQVFVYLEDVDSQGNVNYVTEGMLRAIHRNLSDLPPYYRTPTPFRTFLRADARPLVSGRPAMLKFDLQPTSYLFLKGHRVRIAVAGADADHFRPLPGKAPTLSILRTRAHPSAIDLPVVSRQTSEGTH